MLTVHRYQIIANELGVKLNKLATTVGINSSTINKAVLRNSTIDRDNAHKIVAKYPQFNEDWIMTGEGDMFNLSNFSDVRPSDFIETDPVKTLIAKAKRYDMNMKDMQDALAILLIEHNKTK